MSETPSPTQSPPRSLARQIGRVIFWSLSILIILFLLMMLTSGPSRIELPFVLATGWMRFLARTAPKVTWNWDLVGMGIVSAAVILLLAQRFLTWIVKSVTSARNIEWRWPWKWTWCGLVAITLLFLVGMATGGAAHQLGWIASSQEPWYEEKRGKWSDVSNMRELCAALQLALGEADGNMEEVRRELWKSDREYLRQPRSSPSLMQTYHLLVVTGEDGKAMGTIIFPRNGQQRANVGGYYSIDERSSEQIPFAKLQEFIQQHRTHLIAL